MGANLKRKQYDGRLKSWNRLKAEKAVDEKQPIGIQLGDPTDFSDCIMFGDGVTGEIVVNLKQHGISGAYQPNIYTQNICWTS